MMSPLNILIPLTILFSLCIGFFPSLAPWFALTWAGMEHFFLWQLFTYILIERGPISVNFFLNLAFNMYILWVFGIQLIERSHARLFLILYFGAALFGGLAALAVPHPFLAGPTNAVYAILIAWMLLNQRSQLLLFFSFRMNAQWLILGLIAATLLIDLANSYWAGAASLIASCIYAYFFTLIVWRQPGPFSFLRRFEKRIFQLLERKKKHETYIHSKIFDIKSGEPIIDDDQFMDAMLDRIARHGEESLTPTERKRMKEISKRKK
ncbi:MAG: rhomboid family intramembrane serine protease [Parachlamydiales bacterium]|nr:rhomboid family intramembrane serine protease [Parachlamydiales bacterium]